MVVVPDERLRELRDAIILGCSSPVRYRSAPSPRRDTYPLRPRSSSRGPPPPHPLGSARCPPSRPPPPSHPARSPPPPPWVSNRLARLLRRRDGPSRWPPSTRGGAPPQAAPQGRVFATSRATWSLSCPWRGYRDRDWPGSPCADGSTHRSSRDSADSSLNSPR